MNLARGGEANFFLEAAPDECVAHEDEALAQGHADTVRKFDRSGARAALGAVDDDIVEADAGLDHRLHDGIDLVRLPDAEFDPEDRKSVVAGKSVSVRVDLGGRRIIKKK